MQKIRQRQTNHRWKYIKAHALCLLQNKVYKHTLRIFNKNCFLKKTTVRRTNLNGTFISTLLILFIDLIAIRTKTPLPVYNGPAPFLAHLVCIKTNYQGCYCGWVWWVWCRWIITAIFVDWWCGKSFVIYFFITGR